MVLAELNGACRRAEIVGIIDAVLQRVPRVRMDPESIKHAEKYIIEYKPQNTVKSCSLPRLDGMR